ncbi:Glycosyl transferases group 1 [Marivirga sericea]|uniref:Glycosyl transferases group 1 n=1 Tax=Marivirga sericea TaxID=1028 RepID=A0A1X7JXU4_9BACT|nr:glycosyltransferase [Marivirga sericea]SMG33210.1 Glycosyl transferases group 1 [Marivirga sericea]
MPKHKILFVCPYPFDEAPSQRFRFEQYLPLLEENGYHFHIAPFLNLKAWKILYKPGNGLQKLFWLTRSYGERLLLLLKLRSYDYIFIHREATPFGPPFFEWTTRFIWKKRIIYDFDDAIWLADPSEKGSLKARMKWKSKVKTICKWSFKVSCGNDYLAQFAKSYSENVVINPTTIDTKYHQQHRISESKTITIGWTGTHSTLPYLKPIIPILDKLYIKNDFELLVISNQTPDFDVKYMRFIQWNKSTEIVDLNEIDIGIMPLTDDIWSQGKCGFKLLQYLAINKAIVASPVGVNQKLIKESDAGFPAESEDQWSKAILTLLTNDSLRQELGDNGRKYIQDYYSVQSNSETFLGLFQ